MLPTKLSFLDIETTGLSPIRDRIIEIGIVRVEDGNITDEYETLVDPDLYLPPEITSLTGISAESLLLAPTFRAIKDKIDELTMDSLVVAHNAQFDVSFLKSEYSRLGESFKNKSLCTAKLSRLLFPRFRRHSLDAIVERFGLICEVRHRALPDAKVLWDFYKIAIKTHGEEKTLQVVKKLLKKRSLPKEVDSKLVDKLPKTPGIYVFYGKSGSPLYVGKSVNIKARVLSHFNATHKSASELSIWEQTAHIEFEETEGELSALLKEREKIEQLQPLYNHQLRKYEEMVVLKLKENAKGYFVVNLEKMTKIDPKNLENILGVFKNMKKAKEKLESLCGEYELCKKLVGLEKTRGACFGYQIEKCKGACQVLEPCINYNARFTEAFSGLRIKKWPFSGTILLREGEKGHLINNWCYMGLVDSDSFSNEDLPTKEQKFDYETYKIFKKFLLSTKFAKHIIKI